jgi:thiosulfate/3-mercaptopyruvate sulfurtransferase
MTFQGPLLTSPLVSTQWLADHLGSDNLVIVDASVLPATSDEGPRMISGSKQFHAEGHIPGAVFADLFSAFSDPTGEHPFTKPTAEQFATAAGALGVGPRATVIIYDTSVGQWAARLWWLFRSFGFDTAAVLDGGLTKWTAEEREVTAEQFEPEAARFSAVERPELWVTKDHVERVAAGEIDATLVCGLPAAEFAGTAGNRSRAGHIPGSINVPAGRLVKRDNNTFLATDTLREVFGPDLSEHQVITYCGAGIAAAADALALTLLGHNNVAIYDGSLNEWASDAAAPLTVPDSNTHANVATLAPLAAAAVVVAGTGTGTGTAAASAAVTQSA